jgi:LysR family transcriptional activator of glutamate synthase operon
MKIEYISEFVVLAEKKNYLDASEELYVSQSSLSKHIMSMEEELGVKLFDRTTRNVTLTKYGDLFLEYAKQIDFLRTRYMSAISGLVNLEQGSITIGTMPNMSPYGITDAIYLFTKTYPNFQLKVIESDTVDFRDLLEAGKCDLAFIREDAGEFADDGIERIVVSRDPLVAVFPSSHPLSSRKTVRLSELKDESFILNDPSTKIYKTCIEACQKAGFEPKVSYTGHLLDLVAKGIGITLMVKREAFFYFNDRLTSVLIEPKVETLYCLSYLKSKELTEAAKYFIDCVKSVTNQQRFKSLED